MIFLYVFLYPINQVAREKGRDLNHYAFLISRGYLHVLKEYIFAAIIAVLNFLMGVIIYVCKKIGQAIKWIY